VPIGRKSKKPTDKGWQKRPFDPAQFNGNAQNVAVQLGAASGGLTDVDLDCMDAIGFATDFLPATDAIFGRRSKPCSHQLYVCDLHRTEDAAVIPYAEFTAGRAGQMIVELRIGANGKGATTVFPPSLHVTGESVEWENDGEPARVGGADHKRAVAQLAVAVLPRGTTRDRLAPSRRPRARRHARSRWLEQGRHFPPGRGACPRGGR
jgi:hypothetical protein